MPSASEGAKGNMKELILFRGLPGAGKSTLANALCDVCLSADDFFTDSEGAYHYDKAQIKSAHEDCLSRTAAAMKGGAERIGVANTFTEAWEMAPYYKAADSAGYRIHAVIVEHRGHDRMSIHAASFDVINKMEERFQITL